MKVIILSAGRGERLRPLTDHTPKPLLKAGEKRLIEYTLHSLVKAGLTDIVINTAYLSEQFPVVLGNGEAYGATISYTTEGLNGLETAGGIINAQPLLGNEPFLVVNGDIWTDFPFEQLDCFTLAPSKLGHLVFVNNPEHNPNGDFSLSSGNVINGGENKVTYSGIAIFHPDLFKSYDVQKMALKPVFLAAITKQQLSGQLYQGQWSDIGTAERLEKLAQYIKH
jgi:MurNAc alpha-1-phosphate uridylyltransferase